MGRGEGSWRKVKERKGVYRTVHWDVDIWGKNWLRKENYTRQHRKQPCKVRKKVWERKWQVPKTQKLLEEKALQFSFFDFAFLVGKECSSNADCAWWWAVPELLSSCIFLWPGDADTLDQAGTLFAHPRCSVHNSFPTKISESHAVNTGENEERAESMTE